MIRGRLIMCRNWRYLSIQSSIFLVFILLLSSCSNNKQESSLSSFSSQTESFSSQENSDCNSAIVSLISETDGSIELTESDENGSRYLLTIDIFNTEYSQEKKGETRVEITLPCHWIPRVDDWRDYHFGVQKSNRNLTYYGFKDPTDKTLASGQLVFYSICGWTNYNFDDYQKDIKKKIDYLSKNVEALEIVQLGECQWLKHIVRSSIETKEIEICSDEIAHEATYLCEYKGGVIRVKFFYRGHENEKKLKEQEQILSSWHFVDEYDA